MAPRCAQHAGRSVEYSQYFQYVTVYFQEHDAPTSHHHIIRNGVGLPAETRRVRPPMVSPTLRALVDVVWAVWSIGASIYDYLNASASHQCVIGALSIGVVMLFTYILLKKP